MRSPRLPWVAMVLAGCVSFGPLPDHTRHYTLHAQAAADARQRTAVAAVGLGPVRLPPYLDRPQIVTRTGPERLELASQDRWAAPLDVLFARTLSEDLREAVPAQEVLLWPWPRNATLDWIITVDVVRFEREPDGTAVLEARWGLSRAQGGGPAERGRSAFRIRAADSSMASSVGALSEAVGELAREVAAALARAPSAAASQPERPAVALGSFRAGMAHDEPQPAASGALDLRHFRRLRPSATWPQVCNPPSRTRTQTRENDT